MIYVLYVVVILFFGYVSASILETHSEMKNEFGDTFSDKEN